MLHRVYVVFLVIVSLFTFLIGTPETTMAQNLQPLRPLVRPGPVRYVPVRPVPLRPPIQQAMPVQFVPQFPPAYVPPMMPQMMPQPMPLIPVQPRPLPPLLIWTADAKAIFGRATINWHNDEASLGANRTWGEFGINLVVPARWRLNYSVTTSLASTDSVVPVRSLIVGATDFGQAQGGSGSGGSNSSSQPVSIDYTILPSHRFTLACLSFRNELHPVVMAEYAGISVNGVTTSTGQQKRDNETFRSWFWGIGAEIAIPIPNARAMATITVGDKYLFADLSYYQRLTRWAYPVELGVGWQHKTFKGERGNTLRVGGPYVGAEVVF